MLKFTCIYIHTLLLLHVFVLVFHLHEVLVGKGEQRDDFHCRAERQVSHGVGVEELQHALEGGAVGGRDQDGAGLRAAATLAHAAHAEHGVEVLAAGRQDGSMR